MFWSVLECFRVFGSVWEHSISAAQQWSVLLRSSGGGFCIARQPAGCGAPGSHNFIGQIRKRGWEVVRPERLDKHNYVGRVPPELSKETSCVVGSNEFKEKSTITIRCSKERLINNQCWVEFHGRTFCKCTNSQESAFMRQAMRRDFTAGSLVSRVARINSARPSLKRTLSASSEQAVAETR